MRKKILTKTASTLVIGLSFIAGIANANTLADDADAEKPTDERDVVVVTAQKRAQDVNDIGIAISVIDGQEVKRRNIDNVNKVQYQVPSLEITPAFGGGQPQFRLRGIGFEDYASNNTPTVGTYVDEVSYPIPAATQGVLFDISRIEVLRGPQGTLYGRNTTGGAINFISNRPKDFKEYGAALALESNNYGKFEGYVSGPITEKLKGRLAIVKDWGGAWQKNRVTGEDLGDADRFAAKALLDFDATENVNLLFNIHGGYDKSDGQGLALFAPFLTNTGTATPGPTIPADTKWDATGWGLSSAFANYIGVDAKSKPSRDNTSGGASVTANIKFDNGLKLTSITAYEKLDREELNDWDASASPESDTYWKSDVTGFTQEVRLAKDSDVLNWVAGVFYATTELDEQFVTDFSNSLGFITDTSYTQNVDSLAAFGQAEYKFTPKTKFTIGARVENEKRELRNFATGLPLSGVSGFFPDGDRDTEYTKWSGRIALDHKYNDDVLVYASISSGIKSGGFTVYNSPSPRQIDSFKPERVLAYEAGVKAKLNDKASVNAAIFHYDYEDQQVLTSIINENYGLIGRITNAPKSKIDGVEAELVLKPIDGLRITQTIGYKKGEYVKFDDVDPTTAVQDPVTNLWSAGTINRKGQSLGFPELSYNAAISYAWNVGDYELRAATDIAYRDNLTSWLGQDFNLKSYWLANANFDIHKTDSPWGVNIYAQNITDEEYEITRNFFLSTSKISAHGRPRTFGIRVSYIH